jgi:low affinity Fe/Cu permease
MRRGPIGARRARQDERTAVAAVIAEQRWGGMDGNIFQLITTRLARFIGRPLMMMLCVLLAAISFWAFFRGSDLAINGTNLAINVLTLLFLPILQATQNRDGAALQAKLDELIKVSKEARKELIGAENLAEQQIEELRPTVETVTDPHPAEEPVA